MPSEQNNETNIPVFIKDLKKQIYTLIIGFIGSAVVTNVVFITSINDKLYNMQIENTELKEDIKDLKNEILNIYKK